jgi:hypothetical protein
MNRKAATPLDADVLKGAPTEVARNFAAHLAKYDERKYPPLVLRRLRLLFSEPEIFQPEDIALALRWKFGHLGKPNYPEAQQNLVSKIATLAGAPHPAGPGPMRGAGPLEGAGRADQLHHDLFLAAPGLAK